MTCKIQCSTNQGILRTQWAKMGNCSEFMNHTKLPMLKATPKEHKLSIYLAWIQIAENTMLTPNESKLHRQQH